jgi:hypothetical protein
MRKKIKNNSPIYKGKKLSKHVKSDGTFNVNETVLLRIDKIPNYINGRILYLSDSTVETTIDKIIKINDKEYFYSVINYQFKNKSSRLWVDGTAIRKIDNEDWSIRTAKYTKGQNVSMFTWWGEFYENVEIINIYKSINTGHCNYEVLAQKSLTFIVPEEKILTGKRDVIDSEFKPGDKVVKKYDYLNITAPFLLHLSEEKIIKEVITFDQTQNDIFLKFDNSLLYNSNSFVKCKEPLIIYSEVDPFGEEDWNG